MHTVRKNQKYQSFFKSTTVLFTKSCFISYQSYEILGIMTKLIIFIEQYSCNIYFIWLSDILSRSVKY